MTKTIYNVFIPMESQEQCDRMKQVCIDNGLPIWDDRDAFKIFEIEIEPSFSFDEDTGFYFVFSFAPESKESVSESEFLELLSNHLELQVNK